MQMCFIVPALQHGCRENPLYVCIIGPMRMSLLLKTTTQYGTFISQLARELAPQLVKSATNIFFQKECTTSACSEVSFQFMISSPAPPLTAAMRRRAGAGTPTNSSVIVDGAISDPIIPNKKTVHTHQ